MPYHPDPHKAHQDLDRILQDLASGKPSGGASLPRQARRIRNAVDCLLLEASANGLPADDHEETFDVDVPMVTQAAATWLTIYHLQMAGAYFEASGPELELEIARGFGVGKDVPPSLGLDAARAWLRAIRHSYEELDAMHSEK